MAGIPATLFGFTAFVDGKGYAGRVSRGTPPKLNKALLEHCAAMPNALHLFRGLEKIECDFTLRECNTDITRQMSVYDISGQASLLVRLDGAQLYADGRDATREWEVGSRFTEADFGNVTSNEPETEAKFMMVCSRVKLRIGGSDIWAGVRAVLEG